MVGGVFWWWEVEVEKVVIMAELRHKSEVPQNLLERHR